MREIKLGTYEHFKGRRYEVIGVAEQSETQEELVVYRALYGERKLWVRPLAMFLEEVEVEGKLTSTSSVRVVPRFRYVGEAKRLLF